MPDNVSCKNSGVYHIGTNCFGNILFHISHYFRFGNVYRGSRSGGAFSYNHTCFASKVQGPVTDTDVPPPGTAAYYLITRVTACGESSLGEGRPNPSPCP